MSLYSSSLSEKHQTITTDNEPLNVGVSCNNEDDRLREESLDVSLTHTAVTINSKNLTLIEGKIPILPKGTKFFLLNIRGLVNKMDFLRYLYSSNEVDILCINETFCDNTISDEEVSINGLCIERKDRNRSGGGVALYVSNRLFYTRRYEFEHSDLEMICIQLYIPFQKHIIIFCVYRPPSNDMTMNHLMMA